MGHAGRGLIDGIFSIIVIFVVFGIFAGYLARHVDEARSVALENELTNLKNSLQLYMIMEGRYPEDLRELNKKRNVLGHSALYGKKYLELQAQDKEDYPIDPYGHRFIYDSKSGRVERGMR